MATLAGTEDLVMIHSDLRNEPKGVVARLAISGRINMRAASSDNHLRAHCPRPAMA